MPSTTHRTRRELLAASGAALVPLFGGCTSFLPGESTSNNSDSILVTIDNNHSAEHTVSVTVTGPDGETILEASETVASSADVDVGSISPSEEERSYTIEVELGDGTSESLEFPVGGSSGTNTVFVTISEDGELELSRAYT